MTALATATNTTALAALVHALLKGKAASGPTLLVHRRGRVMQDRFAKRLVSQQDFCSGVRLLNAPLH